MNNTILQMDSCDDKNAWNLWKPNVVNQLFLWEEATLLSLIWDCQMIPSVSWSTSSIWLDGGDLCAEKCADVRPDQIRLCVWECVQDAFSLIKVYDRFGNIFVVSQSGHQGFGSVVLLLNQWLSCDVIYPLDAGRIEAHVVHSATGWMYPSMSQPFLQRFQRNVEIDGYIQITGTVQGFSLS